MASVIHVEYLIKLQISLKEGAMLPFYVLKSNFTLFEVERTSGKIGLS